MAEDPKNPSGGDAPSLADLVAAEVAKSVKPLQDQVANLERRNAELENRPRVGPDDLIPVFEPKANKRLVRDFLASIPRRYAFYFIAPVKRANMILAPIPERLIRHPSGSDEKVEGLWTKMTPPAHGAGTDLGKNIWTLHVDLLLACERIAITKERIAASNKARKAWLNMNDVERETWRRCDQLAWKDGIASPNPIVLPEEIQEPREGDFSFSDVDTGLKVLFKANPMFKTGMLEGAFPRFQIEATFQLWAAIKYGQRWSNERVERLGNAAMRDPAAFDIKSGAGIMELISGGLEPAGVAS